MRDFAGKYWRRGGRCAFAADGSRVECPRTAANERELKCAGRKKTGPQLFLTTLWHMGLGLPWDYRIGPGTASERRHLEDMLPDLPDDAVVVADAGFSGYDLYRRLLGRDGRSCCGLARTFTCCVGWATPSARGRTPSTCGRRRGGTSRRWCCG